MSDEPGCRGCPTPFPQVAADAAPGPSIVRAAASISEATSALEERPANIAARIRPPVPAGRPECHPPNNHESIHPQRPDDEHHDLQMLGPLDDQMPGSDHRR